MSAFKDILKNDINAVFLNTEEFADIHMVDGKPMKALIDNMEHIEREKRMKNHVDGVYVNELLIFVSAEEFGKLPRFGRLLNFDGKDYRVTDAIDEDGMYSITMEANKS